MFSFFYVFITFIKKKLVKSYVGKVGLYYIGKTIQQNALVVINK